MVRRYPLALAVLLLMALWVCAGNLREASAQGQLPAPAAAGQKRFTRAANGVITDHTTGLEWYAGPHRDNTWHAARDWAAHLDVAGGGWRLPTVKELKGIYLPGASRNNLDPLFQADGAWAWSGEPNRAWSAWGFAFYNGLEGWHSMNYGYGRLALAVRSRK